MRLAAWIFGIIGAMHAVSAPPVIRIVSYNIHHGEGSDGVVDLNRIAAILKALSPDVVCLQEVDRDQPRSAHQDFPAVLAGLLDMQAVFDSNLAWEGGEYGNATLTRFPVASWQNISLPGPAGSEPRGCLRTTIVVAGVEVDVLNTHLGLKSPERLDQVRFVTTQLSERPTILLGDLNDRPGSPPLRHLSAFFTEAGGQAGHPTYPAAKARAQIDHILYSPALQERGFRVVDGKTAAMASDHLPIVAEFEWAPDEDAADLDGKGIVGEDDDRIGNAVGP